MGIVRITLKILYITKYIMLAFSIQIYKIFGPLKFTDETSEGRIKENVFVGVWGCNHSALTKLSEL